MFFTACLLGKANIKEKGGRRLIAGGGGGGRGRGQGSGAHAHHKPQLGHWGRSLGAEPQHKSHLRPADASPSLSCATVSKEVSSTEVSEQHLLQVPQGRCQDSGIERKVSLPLGGAAVAPRTHELEL